MSFLAKKTETKEPKILSAQEFVNVRDIKERFLYTKDNLIFSYIRITPLSVDLLSNNEKEALIKNLSAELSSEKKPFKFFAISRPVDITNLINELIDIKEDSVDPKQKELLTHEINEYSQLAVSGDVVERQFYIVIWETFGEDAEEIIAKRARDMVQYFVSCGIEADILKQNEIYQFLNLFANPHYIHLETDEYGRTFPYSLEMFKKGEK